jgi:hypothetical protein
LSGHEPYDRLRRLLRREFEQIEKDLNRRSNKQATLVARAQADLSNRIYHYLATLGHRARAHRGGLSFRLDAALGEGMGQRLGIPDKRYELLAELSDEFREWMAARGGTCETSWGTVRLGAHDELEIEVTSEGARLDRVQPANVFQPDSPERRRKEPMREDEGTPEYGYTLAYDFDRESAPFDSQGMTAKPITTFERGRVKSSE